VAANVSSLTESIDEERGNYFTSLEILKGYDKQRNNRFTDMFIMPAQDRRYKLTGKYDTHVIDPVVTHHVVTKSIKEFVDTDGTVIELY
jgi:hypothetical protein